MVCSLTRTAAREASKRVDLPDSQVGTLHSLAYVALGRPEVAESQVHIKEWNAEVPPEFQIGHSAHLDAPLEVGSATSALESQLGDQLKQLVAHLRTRQTPREEWPGPAKEWSERWEDFKKQCDYVDFTDLIALARTETDCAPGDPAFFALDEAQDFGRLEMDLVQHWGRGVHELIQAGDYHQCQPTGNGVETIAGPVDIADLDPYLHRLVSYDRHDATIVGMKNGYAFKKTERCYQGNLHSITTSGMNGEPRITTCTPEHRFPVRWRRDLGSAWVVYLMRRGAHWRVGWCQVFAPRGGNHLGVRARNEDAEAVWILRVFDSKQEASLYESYVAVTYGLPLLNCKEAGRDKGLSTPVLYTQSALDALCNSLDANEQRTRALRCLRDYGREFSCPFWSREMHCAKRGRRRAFTVAACNLLPGYMQLYRRSSLRKVTWVDFSLTYQPDWQGTVYSLEVAPHHLYLTNDVVSHNSLYRFRGGGNDSLLDPDREVLNQSYRVPAAVHREAMKWMRRTRLPEVAYLPRDYEGMVRHLDIPYTRVEDYAREFCQILLERLDQGKRVMLMATCGYMLEPLLRVLQTAGIPYHNPWRVQNGHWNPFVQRTRGTAFHERILAFMRPSHAVWGDEQRFWTAREIKEWSKLLPGSCFHRGKRRSLEQLADTTPDIGLAARLREWFTDEALVPILDQDLGWYITYAKGGGDISRNLVLNIIKRAGCAPLKTLHTHIGVVVGTVHSLKGAESDCVMVWPDLSPQASGSSLWSRVAAQVTQAERQQEIARVFYVAVTRAREELMLMSCASLTNGVAW